MCSNRYQKTNFKKFRELKIADCIQIDSSHGFEAMFKGIDFARLKIKKILVIDLNQWHCSHEKLNHYLLVWSLEPNFSSVAQLCLTLCDAMDWSTPGRPVHHQLPEFTQTHVHWVGDAIQPSRPLSSPSPPAFNLSQYKGLFKWWT